LPKWRPARDRPVSTCVLRTWVCSPACRTGSGSPPNRANPHGRRRITGVRHGKEGYTMRTHRTRRWRLAAVTASGALVVGSLAMAGGAAADESGEWQIGIADGSGDVITASTGDVFTGEGTLDLKGEYNGVETHVVCDIDPDGLTWQVPSTPPSDSSGGTLSLDVEVPQD